MKAGLALFVLLSFVACGKQDCTQAKAEATKAVEDLAACKTDLAALKAKPAPSVGSSAPRETPMYTAAKKLCESIVLGDAEKDLMTIASVSVTASGCAIVIEAKTKIEEYAFDFVMYDKDDVKLGESGVAIESMSKGDKVKEELFLEQGTARIITK